MSGRCGSRGRVATAIGWIGAAIFAMSGAGCGTSNAQTLTVYNGQHPQLTQALVNAFEQQTGITVNLRTDDSVVLAQQLLQEGSAGPADVFIAENSPELMLLQQHGLFAALPATTLRQVPAQDNSPSGDWVGVAARVSALAYNPNAIAANRLPGSVLDLADPEWAGKIAISPSDSDFLPVVAAVIATRGQNVARTWLQGLKRNATTYQDIETVVYTVNRGAMPAGMINSYYWFRLQLEVGPSGMHSRIHYFPPHDPGGVENISGAAVLASSRHQQNARRFVDFLVSAQAQRILAAGDDFEYPLRPGVASNPAVPPLAGIQPTFIGIAALGNDQAAARLVQQVGLE